LGAVALDRITTDEEYDRKGEFLDDLQVLEHRDVVEVPVNMTVWNKDPASCVRPLGGQGAKLTQSRRNQERRAPGSPPKRSVPWATAACWPSGTWASRP
jgi:hypothetical protein